MKRRLIAAGVVLMLLWVFSIPLAYNMDALLARRGGFTWNPIATLPQVLGNKKALEFLLLSMGIELLAIVACLAAGTNISSRTDMQTVTPDIRIPVAAGQGQFGTARFLSRKKYKTAFTEYQMPDSPFFQELLKEGASDAKEIDKV